MLLLGNKLKVRAIGHLQRLIYSLSTSLDVDHEKLSQIEAAAHFEVMGQPVKK